MASLHFMYYNFGRVHQTLRVTLDSNCRLQVDLGDLISKLTHYRILKIPVTPRRKPHLDCCIDELQRELACRRSQRAYSRNDTPTDVVNRCKNREGDSRTLAARIAALH